MSSDVHIHPSADVHSKNIGAGSRIWQCVVVLRGAAIGKDAKICSHCFVDNDVIIGEWVTVKNRVQIPNGHRPEKRRYRAEHGRS